MKKRDKIYACIASIPARENSLVKTIHSLLPQVDRICLYLNDYSKESVKRIQDISKEKITIVVGDNKLYGDAGKFYWASKLSGYILTCDDDLIYPPDYAKTVVDGIEKYHRLAIVSFHGRILSSPIKPDSYSKSHIVPSSFNAEVKSDQFVHIAGTGTTGFHSSTIKPTISDFRLVNMPDIYFSILAQSKKVPLCVLARQSNWIIKDGAPSIVNYLEYDKAVSEIEEWKLYKVEFQYNESISADVIMLSYTKSRNIYEMTKTAIRTLIGSEPKIKFNIYLIETNKNFTVEFPEGYNANVIIPSSDFNFNKFLNIGLAKCTSKYIVISNNDVIFEQSNWLYKIIDAMRRHGVDSMSPYWKEWFERRNIQTPSGEIWIGNTVGEQVFGYCIVAKKEVFDKIGKLDERFEFWFQDDDYSMQLQKHGFKHALAKESEVRHLGAVSHDLISDNKKYHFRQGMKDVFESKYSKKISFTQKDTVEASAIITNWNESHVSVESAQRLLNEGIEVIVVDNGSDDDSDKLFKKFGDKIKYIRLNNNYGSSIARNIGVCYASHKRTFLIDGDILYVPDTIRKYSAVMDMLPDAGIVGYYDYERSQKNNGAWSGTLVKSEADARIGTITKINCWYPMAWTQYGLFKTSMIKEIRFPTSKPFDSFGWGYEDDWFFYAMRAKGYKSYSVNAPNYYHDKNFGRRELKKRGFKDMFQERRKAFCERWGLSVENYEHTVGWIEKKYIDINF